MSLDNFFDLEPEDYSLSPFGASVIFPKFFSIFQSSVLQFTMQYWYIFQDALK